MSASKEYKPTHGGYPGNVVRYAVGWGPGASNLTFCTVGMGPTMKDLMGGIKTRYGEGMGQRIEWATREEAQAYADARWAEDMAAGSRFNDYHVVEVR